MPVASVLFELTAALYAIVALIVLVQRLPGWSNIVLAGACTVNAAWAVAVAAHPAPFVFGVASGLGFLRAGLWLGFLLAIGRRITCRPRWAQIGMLFGILCGVAAPALALLSWRAPGIEISPLFVPFLIMARIALAIAILMMVENLYRNTGEETRWHINLSCIAVGGLFIYEILLYGDTALHGRISSLLFAGQAPANLVVLPLFFLAARRLNRWKDDAGMSRSAVFYTATLMLSGVFLMGLAAAGEVLRRFGSGWGTLTEATLIFAGCIVFAVIATSGQGRSRLQRLVVDHFCASRYDYQREWVRCISTLSAQTYLGLHRRVVRAVAEIVDSPAGALFLADVSGDQQPQVFRAAGSWCAPELDGISVAPEHPLHGAFRGGDWIAVAVPGAPPWFAEFPDAWLAVPLPVARGLVGFVVVGRARAAFRLDREVFDLLRIVGREVALFVAEQQATQALVEARQFAAAGRRFSFVAHDIKNLAAQLSLLLGNAEQHLENPAFRADMMATLRGAVQKISLLLMRLQSPLMLDGARPLIAPGPHLAALLAMVRGAGSGLITFETDGGKAEVAIEETAFDAIIRHLIDNAVDASPPGAAVHVRLDHEPDHVVISIIDRGRGMSRDFIREKLFRPFVSTKNAGFGLGAFQARALLREAGGDLTVTSSPGKGTCMRVTLPSVALQNAAAPRREDIGGRGLPGACRVIAQTKGAV